MRLNHFGAIVFSGAIWLIIGGFLMVKGLNFVVSSAHAGSSSAFIIPSLSPLIGGKEQAALMLIVFGLLIGFVKGRLVLIKSVKRVVGRILSLPSPIGIFQMYSWKYGLLILSMVALGLSLRWMHLPNDVRGLVDIAIGSALINGALTYFRYAAAARNQKSIDNG
jgi:hypothetical protein